MPFIYLLLFALICMQTHWPAPWLTQDEGCAILVGTLVLTSWLSAGLIARALCWQMTRHPEQRSSIMRRYSYWRRRHFIGLLIAYLAALYLLGWGHVLFNFLTDLIPSAYRSEGNLPGFQLGLLAPFFVGLIASWERFYQIEKTAFEMIRDDERYISRPAYLLLQIRHHFFIVLPPIFVMTLLQGMSVFFPDRGATSYLPVMVMTGILAAAFLTMPILLRLFLGLKPLPQGPLRDRLESTAHRLRFGYSDVLVWHTRDLFANALVTGFIPWIRYIVLTDRLIDELTPDEIEAVFGHEIGHIKHHHLLFYLAFFLTSVIVLALFWDAAGLWMGELFGPATDESLLMLSSFVKLGLLTTYMLLFFGYLSRRCERQADLYGAQTVSTEVFINALEKVADINGIARRRFSWLHPSIAQRIDFLREMRDHPARVWRFHFSIRLMQWGLYLSLGALLVLLWKFDLLDVWKMLLDF